MKQKRHTIICSLINYMLLNYITCTFILGSKRTLIREERHFTMDDVELISTEQNTGNMGKVLF